MLPIRIKACSESDLRMLGNLARNIQRVLPVTQADIDAAAALGKGWVVWKVFEVTDPLDNLRGGTQLVIKQNSIQPGQNVRRVLIVQNPGGQMVVIGPAPSPLSLPDAIADSLQYVKAFGGTEQNGTPTPTTPMDIVSNNGVLKWDSVNQKIYTDGTVETIWAHGKNLFDNELLLDATGWTKTDGVYSGDNVTLYSKYGVSTDGIPLQYKPNTQYTLSYTIVSSGSVSNARFRIYYTDNTLSDGALSGIVTTPTTYTLTSVSGKSISKIVYNYTAGIGDISLKDIQLEQGPTATTYEPYYNGGTATAEMLLKVGNYQDVQSILDGVVTRNVGVKVLDGTENWIYSASGGVWYNFQGDVGAFDTTAMICSHYTYAGADVSIANLTANQFSGLTNGNIGFKSAETTSAADFKTWLAGLYNAGTPVMVVYAKTNSTTESVAGQTLQVQAGNNTLEITQASLNGLELEAEYTKA